MISSPRDLYCQRIISGIEYYGYKTIGKKITIGYNHAKEIAFDDINVSHTKSKDNKNKPIICSQSLSIL